MLKMRVRGTCRNYCRPGLSLIAMRSVEHHEAQSSDSMLVRASESLRIVDEPWVNTVRYSTIGLEFCFPLRFALPQEKNEQGR
jgi:hypothetical protein